MKFSYIIPFTVLLLFLSCRTSKNQEIVGKHPKYVFYFIGDGMGLAQAQSANDFLKATENDSLHFMYFPVERLITTFSKANPVTGSAAAGTALSTGVKTCNGPIGLSCSFTDTLYGITDALKANGMNIGIISTVTIDHATPASFYAHQSSRNDYYEIGKQLSTSGIKYFAGGGYKYPKGQRGDLTELYELDKQKGYTIAKTKKEMNALANDLSKVHIANNGALPYSIDKTENDFNLADFVEKGIDVLNNESGFFMMIEGGKIDWACHENDIASSISEVLDLDAAVQKALEFYEKHPDETLIIITADHETGGMGLGYTQKGYDLEYSLLKRQHISRDVLEKKINKSFAAGNDRNAIFDTVFKYIQIQDLLTGYDRTRLSNAFDVSLKLRNGGSLSEEEQLLYGSYEPISVTAVHIMGEKAGISWTTFHHTGICVPFRAIGAGSDAFLNIRDNTEIPKILFTLFDVENPNK